MLKALRGVAGTLNGMTRRRTFRAALVAVVVKSLGAAENSGTVWAATAGPHREIDRPFRMASGGKTFTAATVLRLAGTTSDVARFFTALLGGDVFADPATLESMLAVPNTNVAREEFGILLGDGAHGLYRLDLSGQTCWSHRGFLGTIALACPEAGVSLVVTTNTALTDPLSIAADLLGLLPAG